jgi:hypothetical protein
VFSITGAATPEPQSFGGSLSASRRATRCRVPQFVRGQLCSNPVAERVGHEADPANRRCAGFVRYSARW